MSRPLRGHSRALGQACVYSREVADSLDTERSSRLVDRFAEHVMRAAKLPPAREADVRDACRLRFDGEVLRVTCTITGSSYERSWNGSEAEAVALVDEAADGTALLIANTKHYAWMRSRH
jgi:hypothetical protein